MEDVQTIKVILAFFLGLLIIFATAKLIGTENKAKWFRKRQQATFFNRRGRLGETCHFGYPCTWQGLIVTIAMYGVVFLAGYGVIF